MAITIRGPILISIHAPQWGATVPGLFRGALRPDFNPRTPVGCDSAQETVRRMSGISIHAPQWGATLGFKQLELLVHFNPRTPVGCDCMSGASLSICVYFNPRTPVGCDAPAHTL